MNSLDAPNILMMIERCAHPRAALEALLNASHQLRLPVNIDRRLNELLRDDLDVGEIITRFTTFIQGLIHQ